MVISNSCFAAKRLRFLDAIDALETAIDGTAGHGAFALVNHVFGEAGFAPYITVAHAFEPRFTVLFHDDVDIDLGTMTLILDDLVIDLTKVWAETIGSNVSFILGTATDPRASLTLAFSDSAEVGPDLAQAA